MRHVDKMRTWTRKASGCVRSLTYDSISPMSASCPLSKAVQKMVWEKFQSHNSFLDVHIWALLKMFPLCLWLFIFWCLRRPPGRAVQLTEYPVCAHHAPLCNASWRNRLMCRIFLQFSWSSTIARAKLSLRRVWTYWNILISLLSSAFFL